MKLYQVNVNARYNTNFNRPECRPQPSEIPRNFYCFDSARLFSVNPHVRIRNPSESSFLNLNDARPRCRYDGVSSLARMSGTRQYKPIIFSTIGTRKARAYVVHDNNRITHTSRTSATRFVFEYIFQRPTRRDVT